MRARRGIESGRMPLETEATAEIRGLIADLQPDDADLLQALHRVNRRYGFISSEAMGVIGEQLRLTPAHVYGVTTYYADFRTMPPATTTIAWCSGAPCMLRNSTGMLRAMEAVLDCRLGETTADGQVELMRGQCNGTCELAPQLWVDGTVVGKLDSARAVTLARALRDGRSLDEALTEISESRG